MSPTAWRDSLREELGPSELVDAGALRVDDQEFEHALRPRDGSELERDLAALDRARVSALIRGGGSRLELGNLARGARVILDTRDLAAIEEFDAGDGVLRARGGARLSEIRRRVNSEGWELPLDPWGESATVGGVLSASAFGPRRLGFGPVRDCLLGLEVVLASGERIHSGGRVVKNVTGYDMGKLYTGSLGTLGVVDAAWLRLKPRAETACVELRRLSTDGDWLESALETSRLTTARAVALVSPTLLHRSQPPPGVALAALGASSADRAAVGPEAAWLLVVELAGDAAAVECERAEVERLHGPVAWASEQIDEVDHTTQWLRALQAETLGVGSARTRMSVYATELAPTLSALAASREPPAVLLYPGLGLVYWSEGPFGPACGDGSDDSTRSLDAMLARCESAVSGSNGGIGGEWVHEVLPHWSKEGRDVFRPPEDSLPIMRALKERFDPNGILNPGRFVGGL